MERVVRLEGQARFFRIGLPSMEHLGIWCHGSKFATQVRLDWLPRLWNVRRALSAPAGRGHWAVVLCRIS